MKTKRVIAVVGLFSFLAVMGANSAFATPKYPNGPRPDERQEMRRPDDGPRQGPKEGPKQGPKPKPKPGPERKPAPKRPPEHRPGPKNGPKLGPRPEPKPAPRPEPRPEPKPEPRPLQGKAGVVIINNETGSDSTAQRLHGIADVLDALGTFANR